MKRLVLVGIGCLVACSAVTADDTPPATTSKGKLIAVGGGTIDDAMAKRILEAIGGPEKQVLIIPCSSERPEAGEESAKAWRERGAKHVNWLACSEKESIPLHESVTDKIGIARFEGAVPLTKPFQPHESPVYSHDHALNAIRAADFIWISGGDQNRLLKILNDFNLADDIRERHRAGATVGGTSAGAAALSKLMLTGQSKLDRIAVEPGDTAEGLGLWPEVVVDQHFLARGRFNRLLAVVMENHQLVGIGIDESTGVIVNGSKLEVFGQGRVLVIDARFAFSPTCVQNGPIYGMSLHYLPSGFPFDLNRQLP